MNEIIIKKILTRTQIPFIIHNEVVDSYMLKNRTTYCFD